jgi:hypothetical protein
MPVKKSDRRTSFPCEKLKIMHRINQAFSNIRLQWIILLLMTAVATWQTAPGLAIETQAVAGHYYLQGVHEVGSELLLHPDGSFEYFLAYGAYDENAIGTWRIQGKRVLLNTVGASNPPRFTLKQSASKSGEGLTILVQDQSKRGLAGIDVFIDYGNKNLETGYTQEYGWRASRPHGQPQAIGLGIRMYNLQPQWFKVEGRPDNYYVFEFSPGDLGRAKFHDTPLIPENGDLVMEREGRMLRYVKLRGR